MKIRNLRINNFRGIKESNIWFDDHTVFVGSNNSGKSTVIEAIALVIGRDRMIKQLTEHDFYGSKPTVDSRILIIVTIGDFPMNDPDYNTDWFRVDRAIPKWVNRKEQCFYPLKNSEEDELVAQIAFSARFDEDTLSVETIRCFHDDDSLIDPFDDGVIVYTPTRLLSSLGFFLAQTTRTWDKMISFGSELFKRLINSSSGIPSNELIKERDRLRNPLSPLENTEELSGIITNINSELSKLFSRSPELNLRITSTDSESLLSSIHPHFTYANGITLPVSRHGTGIISLQVVLLLLEFGKLRNEKKEPFILAIEEPELHLSPGVQRRLIHQIQSVAQQTILTSHSPNVVSLFDPTHVRFLENKNGQLNAKPLLETPLGRDSKNGIRKLFNDNRLELVSALMQEYVLIPEGRTDYELLKLLSASFELKGINLQNDINPIFGTVVGIVPTHSASIIDTFNTLIKIRSGIIVLVDGDTAGDIYIRDLVESSLVPKLILQWGNGWTIEDVISWIIEGDSTILTSIYKDLGIIEKSNLNINKLLKLNSNEGGFKTDYLAYESIISNICDSEECLKRVSILLSDLALQIISPGKDLENFKNHNLDSPNTRVKMWHPCQ